MEAVGVQRWLPASNAVFQRSSHCALFVAGSLSGHTGAEWRDQRETPFTVDRTSAGYTKGVTQTATRRYKDCLFMRNLHVQVLIRCDWQPVKRSEGENSGEIDFSLFLNSSYKFCKAIASCWSCTAGGRAAPYTRADRDAYWAAVAKGDLGRRQFLRCYHGMSMQEKVVET